jgi:steroid delta-isomerase-like uncharacterized protein
MSNQQNINLTKKLFEEVFNKGNLHALNELIANNVTLHDPAAPHRNEGLECFKEIEKKYLEAFPNKKVKIDEIFGFEDRVVVRWTCKGVQKGKLDDLDATNKEFKITGISIYLFSNGKITEIWQTWDRLGLFEQIGEITPVHALHY